MDVVLPRPASWSTLRCGLPEIYIEKEIEGERDRGREGERERGLERDMSTEMQCYLWEVQTTTPPVLYGEIQYTSNLNHVPVL